MIDENIFYCSFKKQQQMDWAQVLPHIRGGGGGGVGEKDMGGGRKEKGPEIESENERSELERVSQ